MKLTKTKLKRMIKEEFKNVLNEMYEFEPGTMGVPSGVHSQWGPGYAPTYKTGEEVAAMEGDFYIRFRDAQGQQDTWPEAFQTQGEAVRAAQELMDGGRKPQSVSVEQKGEEDYGPVWGLGRKEEAHGIKERGPEAGGKPAVAPKEEKLVGDVNTVLKYIDKVNTKLEYAQLVKKILNHNVPDKERALKVAGGKNGAKLAAMFPEA